MAIRPATIIDGMAPATPMPTPTPNVASRIRARWARRCAAAPNPAISAMHAANASRGPSREASRGPNGANRPMHRTGMVVRSPAGAAERPRSARISGSSGPMERSCMRSASDATNSPTTTAMGTRGAGDDTPRMLSDVESPEPLVGGRVGDPAEEPVEDVPEHRLVWSRAMEQRHRRAQLHGVDPAEDRFRRAAIGREHDPCALPQPRPEHRVFEVRDGLTRATPIAYRRDISLMPRPATCGNTNHIQWPVLRPARSSATTLGYMPCLGCDEALEVVRHGPIVRHTRRP